MLLVHTSEVSVDFTGFPLTVSVSGDRTTTEIVIDAGERDDGAAAQRLNLRGRTEDLAYIFRKALKHLEVS